MKIILGSDHAGVKLKEEIKSFLTKKEINFEDLGTLTKESVDYPDYAKKVCSKVKKEKAKGILICGSGTGMAIAANRIKGIRAVAAYDSYSAKMSRHDNDTNVLCLRGRQFPLNKIKIIISIWLKTPFSKASRHKRRIKKLK